MLAKVLAIIADGEDREDMLRTFIQVTALTITLISSFFWIRGSLTLSTKDIAGLSGTYWGYSPPTLKSLSAQKTDSLIAALLLFLSFILQMINLTWPMRIKDFSVDRNGIFAAVAFSLTLALLLCVGAPCLKNYFYTQAEAICKNKDKT